MAQDNRFAAELKNLLAEMRDHPERNHDQNRMRVAVLRKMVETQDA